MSLSDGNKSGIIRLGFDDKRSNRNTAACVLIVKLNGNVYEVILVEQEKK